MITHNKVRGTMNIVPSIEVNIDTVYIRTNITAIQTDDFDGWEYDEIQYGKDEYMELLQKQIDTEKEKNNFLGLQIVDKDIQVFNLQNENASLGEQLVQIDIRLMMGGM